MENFNILKQEIISSLDKYEKKISIASKPQQKIKIYIDEGHGGNHPKTGVYMTNPRDGKFYKFVPQNLEIREGVVNRMMGKEFTNILDNVGIEYMRISHEYLDISNAERAIICNKDYAIQKSKGVKTLLISFHSNADGKQSTGPGISTNGWSVWTTRGTTISDRFAQFWFEEQKKEFGNKIQYITHTQDGDADIEADFDIIFKTLCPAVLVENLFFTNYQDALMLLDKKYQQACAVVCFNAVKRFFGI